MCTLLYTQKIYKKFQYYKNLFLLYHIMQVKNKQNIWQNAKVT